MRRPLTPRRPWRDKRVVLGVTGGIAAYKSVQLARDLTRLGAHVDVVLTRGATQFIQPLSFAGVTGRRAYDDLWSVEGSARHLELGRHADVICVAPATADFLARSATGRADDLLSTTLLATEAPVVICPAMNDAMYRHPQTQNNVRHLVDVLGYRMAGPVDGPLAAGEGVGPGRMLEPERIVQHVGRALGLDPHFAGRKLLVTAGPTREGLDPVRYLGNRSSGKMGYAVAEAGWRRGADVTLVSGPTQLPDPEGIETVRVESALEMLEAVRARISDADLVVFAAAVSDFRPASVHDEKIKKSSGAPAPVVETEENPDIALESATQRKKGSVAVGFALETEDVVENARAKLERKGFDIIVANDPGEDGAGFEIDTNRVTLLTRASAPESLPILAKTEVAEEILDRVASLLA